MDTDGTHALHVMDVSAASTGTWYNVRLKLCVWCLYNCTLVDIFSTSK